MPQSSKAPAFQAEAHRQSLAVAASPFEQEDQAFVDSISDLSLDVDIEALDETVTPSRNGSCP